MNFDLASRNIAAIISALAEDEHALSELLDAITKTKHWIPEIDRHLDTIYRTRLRHLFAPRFHVEDLIDFAYHLNIAASLVRGRSSALAERIECYEALVNDAIDEVEDSWANEVVGKKNVVKLLLILFELRGLSFNIDELAVQSGLETDTLRNRLGLMASAGLITRMRNGANVTFRISDLGSKLVAANYSRSDRILGIGFSERGAYLDRSNSNSVCILLRDTGELILSEVIFGDLGGAIPNERISHFGFYPIRIGGRHTFRLYVDLANPKQRLSLGTWERQDAYQEILTWVNGANSALAAVRLPSIGHRSQLLHRVLDQGELKWVPGFSMSAADQAIMVPYEPEWMSEFADHLSQEIKTQFDRKDPIISKKQQWQTTVTWEEIFDRILDNPHEYKNKLELCMEFLYLDHMRAGKYDVIEIGELQSFSFVIHGSNSRFSPFSEGLLGSCMLPFGSKTIQPIYFDYSAFERLLFSVGLATGEDANDLQGPSWKLCTHNATVTHNIARNLNGSGRLDSVNWQQIQNPADCLAALKGSPNCTVVMCDHVIANDLYARWKMDRGNVGQLNTFKVKYPWPVQIGIGVPVAQPEWKALVHAAFLSSVRSPGAKTSWRTTLQALRKIDVQVKPDYDIDIDMPLTLPAEPTL